MDKIPAMGDDHIEVNQDIGGSGRVTITEAATLLGVHPNTVRGRVKAGVYDAEKIATEHGLTWMIDRDSLINPPLTRDLQEPPLQTDKPEGATPIELVQDLLRPFVEDLGRVREELGAERVLREQVERERDKLAEELEALRETRDAPETASEDVSGSDEAEALPSDSEEPRRSWWRRIFGVK
jgi:hypothetical protein